MDKWHYSNDHKNKIKHLTIFFIIVFILAMSFAATVVIFHSFTRDGYLALRFAIPAMLLFLLAYLLQLFKEKEVLLYKGTIALSLLFKGADAIRQVDKIDMAITVFLSTVCDALDFELFNNVNAL